MNRKIILPINEITDSVEMLREKPAKGMPVFTWIIVLLIGTAIGWCCIGEIDYFVKASGIVRPGESISTVSSLMTGRVEALNISEGDSVKKGDLLFKLDVTDMEQSLSACEKEKLRIIIENQSLKKLEESIINGENLLDNSDPDESAYYIKYEKYVSDLKSISEQYKNSYADTSNAADNTAISVESTESQIEKYSEQLSGLELIKSSVELNEDMFENKNDLYAMQYYDYCAVIDKYNNNLEQKMKEKEKAELLYNAGGIAKTEYDEICRSIENIEIEAERYVSEYKLELEQNITAVKEKISELEYSLKEQNQSYSSYFEISHNEKLAVEKMRLELLSGIADNIKANETNIIAIEKQIADIKLNMKNAQVTASIDGTVNMYSDINESDIVQGGQTIATIVPDTDGAYKLTVYLSSADVGEVITGQKVRLRFSAYPYQEYGELSGTIKGISSDVRSGDNGISYYVAEVSIDDTLGLELISGMECEVRVVTKQRKIIYWLLEKLDFIDN